MYNTFYYMVHPLPSPTSLPTNPTQGSILATSSVYGAHKHLSSTNMDWRLPLWLQMVCPGLVCCVILFFPESPRWLIAQDRHEEARAFRANGDADHPLISLEMHEMGESLRKDPVAGWRSYFDLGVLVRTRARRYRTMLNVTFAWFGQFSGNK